MVLTQDLSQHHKRVESLQAWNATALMLRDESCAKGKTQQVRWKCCPNSLPSTTFLGYPDHSCRCTPGNRNLVLGWRCRPRTSPCGWLPRSIGTAPETREETKAIVGWHDMKRNKNVSLPKVRTKHRNEGRIKMILNCRAIYVHIQLSHPGKKNYNSFPTQMNAFFLSTYLPLQEWNRFLIRGLRYFHTLSVQLPGEIKCPCCFPHLVDSHFTLESRLRRPSRQRLRWI